MRFLVPQSDAEWAQRHEILDAAAAADDPAARAKVNSGRMAEPFWYVDSPLTTPSAVARLPRAGHPRARTPCPRQG
jgi:3-(3-hydroxy-phenyl)propionate hydroxylase